MSLSGHRSCCRDRRLQCCPPGCETTRVGISNSVRNHRELRAPLLSGSTATAPLLAGQRGGGAGGRAGGVSPWEGSVVRAGYSPGRRGQVQDGNQRLCWGRRGKEMFGNCSTTWERLQGWHGACPGRGFEVLADCIGQ